MATLACERVWVDKVRFDIAERQYYENLNKELYVNSANGASDAIALNVDVTKLSDNIEQVTTKSGKQKKSKKSKAKKNQNELSTSSTFDDNTGKAATVTNINAKIDNTTPRCVNVPPQSQQENEIKSNTKKNKKKTKSKGAKNSPENGTTFANNVVDAQLSPTQILLSDSNDVLATANCDKKIFNFQKNWSATKVKGAASNNQCTLVSEIAKAREHIKNSLEKMDGIATLAASPVSSEAIDRIAALEKDRDDLRKIVENLKSICLESQKRIVVLEGKIAGKSGVCTAAPTVSSAAAAKKSEADDDDGVDLFASDSDEESAEAARVREERLAAYAAKKSKKPALIAKSSLVLDVKPWDDETDLKVMEADIRKITADGLLWGASKFVPVAFGIQKLSISCVVEDEKISIDWLTEEIEKLEDYVQSVDVAAFNKI